MNEHERLAFLLEGLDDAVEKTQELCIKLRSVEEAVGWCTEKLSTLESDIHGADKLRDRVTKTELDVAHLQDEQEALSSRTWWILTFVVGGLAALVIEWAAR